jgi:outer membrane lipase/esterase
MQAANLLSRSALAALCLVVAQAAHAAYSSLYVFGDSLTDSGNVYALTHDLDTFDLLPDIPPAPYFGGRFSNGYNFADRLNQRLFGVPLTPSLLNGTNFAVGGATTGSSNRVIPPNPVIPPGMISQLEAYLPDASSQADPNALYLVYGGSNDIFNAVDDYENDPASGDALRQQAVSQAMANLGGIIDTLSAHGAQHFLVPNLADIGSVPSFVAQGALSSFASQASSEFNAALAQLLSGYSGLDIRKLDVAAAYLDALAGKYGFVNTTQACYGGGITGGPPAACATPDGYLFWDDIHPTAETHRLLGDLAYAAAVPEAQTWALVLLGLAAAIFAARRRAHRLESPRTLSFAQSAAPA